MNSVDFSCLKKKKCMKKETRWEMYLNKFLINWKKKVNFLYLGFIV